MKQTLLIKLLSLVIGIYVGEAINGQVKYCYYDSPKGRIVVTIASHQLCPMQVDV